jgi:hypothetical protein
VDGPSNRALGLSRDLHHHTGSLIWALPANGDVGQRATWPSQGGLIDAEKIAQLPRCALCELVASGANTRDTNVKEVVQAVFPCEMIPPHFRR